MAKLGNSLTYDGIDITEKYDLILVSFEQSDTMSLGLNREIIKGETNAYRQIANQFTTKYSDVLQFNICLMKNIETHTNQDYMISRLELSEIATDLTSASINKKLVIDDEYFNYYSDEIVYYIGIFTDIEPLVVDGVIKGITCTFTNNSPFAYRDKQIRIIKDTTVLERVTTNLYCDNNDLYGYTYPKITITAKETGEVTLMNTSDTLTPLNIRCVNAVMLTLDCQKLTIKDSIGISNLSDLGLGDESYIYFPRLKHGNNTIVVKGKACTVNIYWTEFVKVGEY